MFILCQKISAVNFVVAWCLLACSMNLSISSLLVSHKENTSSMYSFDSSDLMLLWLKIIFYCAHENIGKSNCHFYAHCSDMRLKIVSSVKLEVIFFTKEPKHFSYKGGRYRKVVLVENFVWLAYKCYAFLGSFKASGHSPLNCFAFVVRQVVFRLKQLNLCKLSLDLF